MRRPNWFHRIGVAVWLVWIVLGLAVVGPSSEAYWLAPLALLVLAAGGAVLVSTVLRPRRR